MIPSASNVDPEQAEPAEREDQADAGDGGRQHDRQLDQVTSSGPPGEPARSEEVGGRRAEQQDRGLRDERRLQADDERIGDDRIRKLVQQPARRHVREDRDDRYHEEPDRDEDREEEQHSKEPANDRFSVEHGGYFA